MLRTKSENSPSFREAANAIIGLALNFEELLQ
jgi:hypothetical protein